MKELYISKEIKQAKRFLSSHDCKRESWKQEKKRSYQPNQTWLLKLSSTAEEKKKQFYIHLSNRILTCTENHRSCKTTNEKTTIFQRMQKYKDKSFLTQKAKLFSVARYWGARKSSRNNQS